MIYLKYDIGLFSEKYNESIALNIKNHNQKHDSKNNNRNIEN